MDKLTMIGVISIGIASLSAVLSVGAVVREFSTRQIHLLALKSQLRRLEKLRNNLPAEESSEVGAKLFEAEELIKDIINHRDNKEANARHI